MSSTNIAKHLCLQASGLCLTDRKLMHLMGVREAGQYLRQREIRLDAYKQMLFKNGSYQVIKQIWNDFDEDELKVKHTERAAMSTKFNAQKEERGKLGKEVLALK